MRPYGANEALETWMARGGWKWSRGHTCVHWLAKGRCGVRECINRQYDWMDHPSGWIREGERMLLYQPYHLTQINALASICNEFNLVCHVHGGGWYGHGTVAIELRPSARKEEP